MEYPALHLRLAGQGCRNFFSMAVRGGGVKGRPLRKKDFFVIFWIQTFLTAIILEARGWGLRR